MAAASEKQEKGVTPKLCRLHKRLEVARKRADPFIRPNAPTGTSWEIPQIRRPAAAPLVHCRIQGVP